MSTGSWFKAHRKQTVTHTSIVVAFVLFIIFVSGPLFDSLDAVQGESRLCDFPLPAETNDIRFNVNCISTDRRTLEMKGYAFIEGEDSDNSQVYIVLKSPSQTYIFDTIVEERRDVTRYFEELNLNLDYSGFIAIIPARKVTNGEYIVGIYIRKGDIEALQYTSKAMTKSKGTVQVTG